MKQRITTLLLVLLPLMVCADPVEINGLYYNLTEKSLTAEVTQTQGSEYSGDITIPETVEYSGKEYTVTSIGSSAFFKSPNLESVSMPNTITSIGGEAFFSCYNLAAVTLSESLTDIPSGAFASTALVSVVIPDGVVSIEKSAFSNCTSLKSVTLPSSVSFIDGSFSGCSENLTIHITDLKAWLNMREGGISSPYHLYLNGEELTDLVIPDDITEVNNYRFARCVSLKSVTFHENVTSIGYGSFSYCDNITTLNTLNVSSIYGSFEGCKGLVSVNLPAIKYIGKYSFGGCEALRTVIIGSSVERIENQAFANCKELVEVFCQAKTLPSTEEDVFMGSQAGSVTLHVPAGMKLTYSSASPWSGFGVVTEDQTPVFDGDTTPIENPVLISGLYYNLVKKSLTAEVTQAQGSEYSGDITIPETVEYSGKEYTVTSIGSSAFFKSPNLESVSMPNTITSIGGEAFFGCYNLAAVTLSESLTDIPSGAFASTALVSVVIPDGVVSIEKSAFSNCTSLKSVTLPSSVSFIDGSFSGCSENLTIHITDLKAWLNMREGGISSPYHLYLNGEELTDLVIPDDITEVNNYRFARCVSLKSVTFHENVTSIGYGSFSYCDNITTLNTLNVSSIYGSFEGCKGLVSVNLPAIKYIGKYSFGGCEALRTVTIGSSVERIENQAFANCKELVEVFCQAKTLPSTEEDVFMGSQAGSVTLHVPAGMKLTYSSASPWSGFGVVTEDQTPVFDGDTTPIENPVLISGLYYNLVKKSLTAEVTQAQGSEYSGDITIPETVEYSGKEYTVTSIGSSAFFKSPNLESVSMPNTITSIGGEAFFGCYNLAAVTLSESLTDIPSGAFASTALVSVVIPDGVVSIEKSAFSNCTSLKSVTLPSSVSFIDGSFSGCSENLTIHITDLKAWLNMREGGISSPYHLYLNGEELTDLVIPDDITEVNNYRFARCVSLKSVTFHENVTSIGYGSFSYCDNITTLNTLNVSSIYGSFEGCKGLVSVNLPAIKYIGKYSFGGCEALRTVTIGSSVEEIEYQAFANCKELAEVFCQATTLPTTAENAFQGSLTEYSKLYVPAEARSEYAQATPWSNFGTIASINNGEMLTLTVSGDNFSALTENYMNTKHVKIDGATYYKDGCWNTLCLPFSLDEAEIASSPLSGVTLKELTGATLTDGELVLTFATATSIEAGKAYLAKWESGENIVSPTFSDVIIRATSSVPTEQTAADFVGLFSSSPITGSELIIGSNNKIGYAKSGMMKAFGAYFKINTATAPARIRLNTAEGTTSIIDLQQDSHPQGDAVYRLDGVRVSGEPSSKGIYIRNGKKIIR